MRNESFAKSYERDTTFSLQGFFSKCLLGANTWRIGEGNSHRPLYLHYFDGVNVQFFENREGMEWFADELLKKCVESPEFVRVVVADQYRLLQELEPYWVRGSADSREELCAYLDLARRAMVNLTLYFLCAMDERTSQEIKDLTVELRKVDELGAKHDAFVRAVVAAKGYPAEWANVLLAEELVELPPREVVTARMQGVVLVDGTDCFVGSVGAYAVAHPRCIFEGLVEGDGSVTEVHGQVAQKGQVVGRVRIVKNRMQANLVEAGEVIVSPMTTPDFIAGMHKAAAFVTDEGGIVCHAAIVAREMKKPCIIGTKSASTIFKDGDLVEVDANTGLVRIFRRE